MLVEWVTVGRIRTVFGVKGWLKVESFTEPADNLLRYGQWRLVADEKARKPIAIQLENIEQRQSDIIIRMVGVENREDARQFANHLIQVPKSELPELDAEDFYWHELEGLDVFQVDKAGGEPQLIGQVVNLLETGSNDVLIVKCQPELKQSEEVLIPYLPDDVVKQVNLDTGQIWVDWDYLD